MNYKEIELLLEEALALGYDLSTKIPEGRVSQNKLLEAYTLSQTEGEVEDFFKKIFNGKVIFSNEPEKDLHTKIWTAGALIGVSLVCISGLAPILYMGFFFIRQVFNYFM